jgi:uncharacterized membrane protein YhhN
VNPSGLAAIAAVLSATFHLRAEYRGPRWHAYVFKPLTTGLLLTSAAIATPAQGPRYQVAVTIGLALSLMGDVFLMLPKDLFLTGLGSFLLAHLAYLVAFTSGLPIGTAPALLLPLLAVASILIRLLWPGLGRLRLPVLLYTAVIVLMVWQAWARGWEFRTLGAGFAAVGATSFMLSDSLLALNRFRWPWASAQAFVMSTYVAAQALIALSAGTP